MARALFLSLPLHGHVNPTLPLVRELGARGDEVVYFATEQFASAIEGAGGLFRLYRDEYLREMHELPVNTDELSWLLMRTASTVLAGELENFRRERPDYVITDAVAPWGQWVGKILGVPVVTSIPTFAVNRHVMGFAVRQGVRPRSGRRFLSKLRHMLKASRLYREMRRTYGVDGPGVIASVIGRSGLNIVYTSRAFQPCAETFDDSYCFVGPSTARVEDIASFPWEALGDAPKVYVSLGTLFNDNAEFYRACFEALGGEDIQVVLALGTKVSRAALGAPPANFVIVPRVPQLALLARVQAFVSHGGMNSVSESLSFGVPLVVIPQMSEQELVGRQVQALGAGVCLTREEVTPDRLRAAVRGVLSDESFRRAAGLLREGFAESGGVVRGAEAIASTCASGAMRALLDGGLRHQFAAAREEKFHAVTPVVQDGV